MKKPFTILILALALFGILSAPGAFAAVWSDLSATDAGNWVGGLVLVRRSRQKDI